MKNSFSDIRFRLRVLTNLARVYWRYYVLPYVLFPALAGAVFGYYAPDIACYCAQQYRNYRDQRSELRGPPSLPVFPLLLSKDGLRGVLRVAGLPSRQIGVGQPAYRFFVSGLEVGVKPFSSQRDFRFLFGSVPLLGTFSKHFINPFHFDSHAI